MAENLLCYGDNAYFLNERRDLFPDESVDLLPLDPRTRLTSTGAAI